MTCVVAKAPTVLPNSYSNFDDRNFAEPNIDTIVGLSFDNFPHAEAFFPLTERWQQQIGLWLQLSQTEREDDSKRAAQLHWSIILAFCIMIKFLPSRSPCLAPIQK